MNYRCNKTIFRCVPWYHLIDEGINPWDNCFSNIQAAPSAQKSFIFLYFLGWSTWSTTSNMFACTLYFTFFDSKAALLPSSSRLRPVWNNKLTYKRSLSRADLNGTIEKNIYRDKKKWDVSSPIFFSFQPMLCFQQMVSPICYLDHEAEMEQSDTRLTALLFCRFLDLQKETASLVVWTYLNNTIF